MTQEKLDMYLMTNQKYLPADKAVFLKETLKKIDDSKFTMVSAVEFKDPTTLLLVSIFLGALGIDRFTLGDTGMGILKLLTGAVCAVFWPLSTGLLFKKARAPYPGRACFSFLIPFKQAEEPRLSRQMP